MPRVAQYGPSRVSTQVVRGARATDAPAGAFGGAITQGLSALAQGAAQVQQRFDTTASEEALVQFERDKNNLFFDPDSGYFNSQGRDAYDNAGTASEALVELKSKYSETLSSPNAKRMFDTAASAHIARGNQDIMRHASKGLQAWEVATVNTQIENTLENASLYWSDPQRMKVQNALGRQAVIDAAELQGLSSGEVLNERLQNYESSFNRSVITAATNSSAAEGQAAFEKHGDRLEGPDKIKVEAQLQSRWEAEKTQQDAQLSVLTATNLVDTFEKRNDIIDEVNKIEDPELRKKTMSESMTRFNQRKKAENEERANNYDLGIDHITAGGTVEGFKAANPEAWENMDSKQRNTLASGKFTVTDQALFNNLLTLPPKELAKVDANDHVTKLNRTDLNKLRTSIERAGRGQNITQVQSLAAKTKTIAKHFFKDVTNDDSQLLMQTVQDVVQDAEELKGSKLTPREVDDVLDDFTRKLVIERSAFGVDLLFPDVELDLSNTPPDEVRALNIAVDNLGEGATKDLVQIREALIENNIPVTTSTLINAYRQGTR